LFSAIYFSSPLESLRAEQTWFTCCACTRTFLSFKALVEVIELSATLQICWRLWVYARGRKNKTSI